jgi:ubiquinone/menaquinone biosynthesis C-methylase UbiE
MDCEALDFPSDTFDVVFTNALMEYLVDYGAFFDGSLRVLKPVGLLICSTKNGALSFSKLKLKRENGMPLGTPEYDDHKQEFTAQELRSQLESRFVDVSMYGECMGPRAKTYMIDTRVAVLEYFLERYSLKRWIPWTWRDRVRRLMTGVEADQISSDDFEIVPGEFVDCWYVVGCGTKREG